MCSSKLTLDLMQVVLIARAFVVIDQKTSELCLFFL